MLQALDEAESEESDKPKILKMKKCYNGDGVQKPDDDESFFHCGEKK